MSVVYFPVCRSRLMLQRISDHVTSELVKDQHN